jgi:hypothetical protein
MNIEDPNPGNDPDALERRLQTTPLAAPPAAWRSEILARAIAEAPAPTASSSARRAPLNDGFPKWLQGLRHWLRGIPAEWGAVAGLALLVVALNWPLSGGSGSGDVMARNSSREVPPVEGAVTMMASRESLLRELGLTDEMTPSPRYATPPVPADKAPRRQLNRNGTNDVMSGWA